MDSFSCCESADGWHKAAQLLGSWLRLQLEVALHGVGRDVHHRRPVLLEGRDGQLLGLVPGEQVPEIKMSSSETT